MRENNASSTLQNSTENSAIICRLQNTCSVAEWSNNNKNEKKKFIDLEPKYTDPNKLRDQKVILFFSESPGKKAEKMGILDLLGHFLKDDFRERKIPKLKYS